MNKSTLYTIALTLLASSNLCADLEKEKSFQEKYSEKIERLQKGEIAESEKVSYKLQEILQKSPGSLDYVEDNGYLEVTISLDNEAINFDDTLEDSVVMEAITESGKVKYVKYNDKKISNKELLLELQEQENFKKQQNLKKTEKIVKKIKQFARKNALVKNVGIKEALEKGKSTFSLKLKKKVIKQLITKDLDSIAAIELSSKISPTIYGAMSATKVDPIALNDSTARGDNIGIYISESNGCPNESEISGYTRLSGDSESHSRHVVSIVRAVAPNSSIFCEKDGYYIPNSLRSPSNKVYVQNYSWTYINNDTTVPEYEIEDRTFDNNTFDDNVLSIIAASNIGYGPYIGSPAKALNVLTVGNYDDTSNEISDTSVFIDSEIANNKPEVSAPGTDINIDGIEASGTSYAAPYVTGFAANLMSKYSFLRDKPYLLKSYIMATATDNIAGGENKVGVGGVNFQSAVGTTIVKAWDFPVSEYDSYAQENNETEHGHLPLNQVYIPAGKTVYTVLTWFIKGSYTYTNKESSYPLGLDLDLFIQKPTDTDNSPSLSSMSDYNPYEYIKFTTTTAGMYNFQVHKMAERDPDLGRYKVGLTVFWE